MLAINLSYLGFIMFVGSMLILSYQLIGLEVVSLVFPKIYHTGDVHKPKKVHKGRHTRSVSQIV